VSGSEGLGGALTGGPYRVVGYESKAPKSDLPIFCTIAGIQALIDELMHTEQMNKQVFILSKNKLVCCIPKVTCKRSVV